jgi:hypothetical protein
MERSGGCASLLRGEGLSDAKPREGKPDVALGAMDGAAVSVQPLLTPGGLGGSVLRLKNSRIVQRT